MTIPGAKTWRTMVMTLCDSGQGICARQCHNLPAQFEGRRNDLSISAFWCDQLLFCRLIKQNKRYCDVSTAVGLFLLQATLKQSKEDFPERHTQIDKQEFHVSLRK